MIDADRVCKLILDLSNNKTREYALSELSSKREQIPDLAPLLWHSFGSITILVTEICSVYHKYDSPYLTVQQGNRVCNALALLQVIASHSQTIDYFLESKILLFLYPFLQVNNVSAEDKPFEYLKLTTLGVIGALVKTSNKQVIPFLLSSEIIPLCLNIMESNLNELSKLVATFIVQKILESETGLQYCCDTFNRFKQICLCLNKMIISLSKSQSLKLFKHVIGCYQKLSVNQLARKALKTCLPYQLHDGTFSNLLKDDKQTLNCLTDLLKSLN